MTLEKWQRDRRWTDRMLMRRINRYLSRRGKPYSYKQVYLWRKGLALPGIQFVAAIAALSDGAVTEDDHQRARREMRES